MKLSDAIAHFHRVDCSDSIPELDRDKKLQTGLLVWQSMTFYQYNPDEDYIYIPGEDPDWLTWDAIWNWFSFDVKQFSSKSGMSMADSNSVFERLKAIHLIYPDGSVHNFATMYMKAKTQAILKRLSNSKGGRPKKNPDQDDGGGS